MNKRFSVLSLASATACIFVTSIASAQGTPTATGDFISPSSDLDSSFLTPVSDVPVITSDVQVLDFEGIANSYPFSNSTLIGEFYNGAGGPEKNFGISFSSNALNICLNSLDVFCSNTSRGGQGNPNSPTGGLFFLTGAESIMTRTAGFEDGFSFFYTAIGVGGSFTVYDGPNGTGNVLTSTTLPITTSGPCPGYNAGFCPFVPFGVSFNGVAQSVAFAGVANQIVFDDVTFGSSTPDPTPDPRPSEIPEPTSILGSIILGGLLVKFKKKSV